MINLNVIKLLIKNNDKFISDIINLPLKRYKVLFHTLEDGYIAADIQKNGNVFIIEINDLINLRILYVGIFCNSKVIWYKNYHHGIPVKYLKGSVCGAGSYGTVMFYY